MNRNFSSQSSRRRSEGARGERTQRGEQNRKPQPAARRSVRTARSAIPSPPPVMVRREASTQTAPMVRERTRPARGAQQRGSRRRVDVRLGVPGAEMRLPSLPNLASWRLLSLLLTAALSGLIYYIWSSPVFRVDAPQIVGLQRLAATDVIAILNLTDQPIFTVNPAILQKRLKEAFPEFVDVEVEVALPDQVAVKVTERQPVIAWRQEGRIELVDADGFAFLARSDAQAAGLPLVEAAAAPPAPGPLPAQTDVIGAAQLAALKLDPAALAAGALANLAAPTTPSSAPPARHLMRAEMVSAALGLSAQVPPGSALIFTPQHGFGWTDARGWDAYFGDAQEMDLKIRVYNAIVERLLGDGSAPAIISVEYVHAPYYRLEK